MESLWGGAIIRGGFITVITVFLVTHGRKVKEPYSVHYLCLHRVRNLKFAIYLKFATCENTDKINELW